MVVNYFSDGTLLIIEKVLNEDKVGPVFANIMDVRMLHKGGLERNISEYKALLKYCGFTVMNFTRRDGNNMCDSILAKKH